MQNQERDEGGQFTDQFADERLEQEQTVSGGESGISRRGFASMSEEQRRKIAQKGGRSQGKENNPANFANRSREEVAAIGAKGGANSRGGGRQSDDSVE